VLGLARQGSERPELVKVPEKNSLHPDRRITLGEIEQEAETVAELKAELAKLRRMKTPAIGGVGEAEVQRRVREAVAEFKRQHPPAVLVNDGRDEKAFRRIIEIAQKALGAGALPPVEPSAPKASQKIQRIIHAPAPSAPRGGLSGPEQRILDAIAWMASIGLPEPDQAAVAFLAGYSGASNGAYKNPRGALNQRGLVRYVAGGAIALTDAGTAAANQPGVVASLDELHARVLSKLGGPEQRILRRLIEVYPKALSNDRLAMDVGYTDASNGAYKNPRGRLRTFGLVDYRDGGVVARDLLFPKGTTR
jgi:ribosomal protein L10